MKIRTPRLELGQWNAECHRCGFTFKSGQLRKEWTGLRVCSDCWEPRHPQDHLRGKPDRQANPWSNPRSDGADVSVGSGNEVTEDDL
jgi:hypothetical protein